jgi:hypothetical protein
VEEQPQQNPIPRDRYRDAEAQLGGADSVEKTTYVVGKGTDPNARKGDGPAASASSRGAPTIVLVVVLVLAALVALAYMVGIVR